MTNNSQSRKYIMTINNPDECGMTTDAVVEQLGSLTLDYWCLAHEIAFTGTPHIHLYLYSHNPIRFSTIKSRFPVAHIEKAYGSSVENRSYILKEGKWADSKKAETSVKDSFLEGGELPTEGTENAPMISRVMQEIREGKTISRIIQEYPKYAFRIKELEAIKESLLAEKYMCENRELEVTYIYGETGTGKTSGIYKSHVPSEICRITNYSSNGVKFDAYHGHDVLVFEEFRSQIPLADFLSYLDVYPIFLPARYSDRVACYTHVYILSNISLLEQYVYERKNERASWNALLRRINHVYFQQGFDNKKEIRKEDLVYEE